jgi:hypothetical protein
MKSKDERKWRQPPEANVAGPRLLDYTSDRSVAVIQRPRSPAPDCGSATCIAVGDRWFLATAAHNIDCLADDADIQLLPRAERSHPGIPFLRRSHPRSVPFSADVAWLELDAAAAARGGLQAVPLSQLSAVHRIPDAYFIQGYPSREVEQDATGGFDPLSMCVGVVSVTPVGAGAAIGLEYPPNSEDDVGLQLVHPRGFSGGGVWTYNPLRVFPHINVEGESLVAIITTYHAARLTLDAVSIASWVGLLSSDYPELGIHVKQCQAAVTGRLTPRCSGRYPGVRPGSAAQLIRR